MKVNVMKLFRDLMKLGKVETPEGILIYEGDVLGEGTEVFVEDENGNIVPAPDGTYGDYKVVDGKIAPVEVEEPAEPETPTEEPVAQAEEGTEPEPETPAEPETPDYEERIAALENAVAELKAVIAEMVAQKEELEFSKMKPAEKEIKDIAATTSKGAMKYFE